MSCFIVYTAILTCFVFSQTQQSLFVVFIVKSYIFGHRNNLEYERHPDHPYPSGIGS